MNDDNGFSASWGEDDENQHPFTYNWFNKLSVDLNNVNRHQTELECELVQLDILDYMVEQMPAFPDAEEIIERIRNNIK